MRRKIRAEFPRAQRQVFRSQRRVGNRFEQYHLVLESSQRGITSQSWGCWREEQQYTCSRQGSRNKTQPHLELQRGAQEATPDFLPVCTYPHTTRVMIIDQRVNKFANTESANTKDQLYLKFFSLLIRLFDLPGISARKMASTATPLPGT